MESNFKGLFEKIVSSTHTKMLGIGKNYPSSADPSSNTFPSTPIVFLKSMDSILKSFISHFLLYLDPIEFTLPKHGGNLIHEIELGFMISKEAKEIEESNWEDYIAGRICTAWVVLTDS